MSDEESTDGQQLLFESASDSSDADLEREQPKSERNAFDTSSDDSLEKNSQDIQSEEDDHSLSDRSRGFTEEGELES